MKYRTIGAIFLFSVVLIGISVILTKITDAIYFILTHWGYGENGVPTMYEEFLNQLTTLSNHSLEGWQLMIINVGYYIICIHIIETTFKVELATIKKDICGDKT